MRAITKEPTYSPKFQSHSDMEPKIKETAWNPEIEKQILKHWQESRIYDFHPEGDVFVIDTPPPYPSGRPWHIGAAAHYAQIDMIARTERMSAKTYCFQ